MSSPPSFDGVSALLEHSAYDPTIVPQLEAYVKAQITSPETSPYHFDANRTLAKLYQFFPHLSDGGATTALIFFLALLEFPSTDFVALGCLVPEKVQVREPCATVCRCAELLENCQFEEFWPTFHRVGSSGEEVAGDSSSVLAMLASAAASVASVDKIRLAILRVLALTYRVAPLGVVLSSLNMEDESSLNAFIGRAPEAGKVVASISSSDRKSVTFVPTPDNTKRSRVYKEEINFESIATLMAAARE